MTITLDPEQEEWLKTRVARGDFASVEAAARQLIDERIAELALEGRDDLAWAKPYVDEALAEVARGKEITLEEHRGCASRAPWAARRRPSGRRDARGVGNETPTPARSRRPWLTPPLQSPYLDANSRRRRLGAPSIPGGDPWTFD